MQYTVQSASSETLGFLESWGWSSQCEAEFTELPKFPNPRFSAAFYYPRSRKQSNFSQAKRGTFPFYRYREPYGTKLVRNHILTHVEKQK